MNMGSEQKGWKSLVYGIASVRNDVEKRAASKDHVEGMQMETIENQEIFLPQIWNNSQCQG